MLPLLECARYTPSVTTPRPTRGVLDDELAGRLVRAAGFRNLIAHAHEKLDMAVVSRGASEGPRDLRAFLVALRGRTAPTT